MHLNREVFVIIETLLIISNTSYQKTVAVPISKDYLKQATIQKHIWYYTSETEHPHWIIALKIENGTLVTG